VRQLIAPAAVLDVTAEAAADPNFLLEVSHIKAFEAEYGALPDGGWLLIRTGWDARSTDQEAFLNGGATPGVSIECAKWLADEAAIQGVGVETVAQTPVRRTRSTRRSRATRTCSEPTSSA